MKSHRDHTAIYCNMYTHELKMDYGSHNLKSSLLTYFLKHYIKKITSALCKILKKIVNKIEITVQ